MSPKTIILFAFATLSCACAPKIEAPSLQIISLVNNTEKTVNYDVSINGESARPVSLPPRNGISFWGLTPTRQPAKADFENAQGEKIRLRGTGINLQTVRNGSGGVSPQGTFGSFRYANGESFRKSLQPGWEDMAVSELMTLKVKIKKEGT